LNFNYVKAETFLCDKEKVSDSHRLDFISKEDLSFPILGSSDHFFCSLKIAMDCMLIMFSFFRAIPFGVYLVMQSPRPVNAL
jgi:hypothetical protein